MFAVSTVRVSLLAIVLALGGTACGRSDSTSRGTVAVVAFPQGGTIKIVVDGHGFTPSAIEVKKGAHVVLEFRRTSEMTCARSVVLPELTVTRDLPLDVPVQIEIPTDTARTVDFGCGMGMLKGALVIR
jgi:plastocyanin domain-containing protein